MNLKIAFCGDIMPGAEVAHFMGNARMADWLRGVSPAWDGADLLIGNLESPCVIQAKPIESDHPELVFHAPASRLQELADAGFSAVTLANNHILNCGPDGLSETVQEIKKAGLYHTGAGMNLTEALQPAFIPVRDKTVGLVAFCYGPPAGNSSPGVAPCDPSLMQKALAVARANADIVIAILHDGLEYSDVPPAKTRSRFRYLAENGADIVIGHHPHVLQGIEWHGSIPIAYSLGDFLFHNSLPHVTERNFSRMVFGRLAPEEVRRDPHKFGRGAVLTIQLSNEKKSAQWHPFRQGRDLRPQLSSGSVYSEDLLRLEDLSAALLNTEDPRHVLANELVARAQQESWDQLGSRELFKLLLKPKWRYVPHGLSWVKRNGLSWVKRKMRMGM
jgi:poly-gamma-glutamate capsule biosynthesis protein CapA/YwtB (metallophosphatase superfamily)